MKRNLTWTLFGAVLALCSNVLAVLPSAHEPLPDSDSRRRPETRFETPSADQVSAAAHLRQRVPEARVDFDDLTASPKMVSAPDGFLSGPGGSGKSVSPRAAASFSSQPHAALKAFLEEHRPLFGFGPEALTNAAAKREFVTPQNGLTTAVWEQQLDGIRVFEGVLVAHTTRAGELVNVSSQFLPDPAGAANAGTPGRAALQASPTISASKAVVLAAENVGENLTLAALKPKPGTESSPDLRARFTATGLKGDCEAKLVWLPINSRSLRLCWDVVLMSVTRNEMFRSVVDAQTGEILVRRCLTENLSDATYRVYTSDSPSPMSPGLPVPGTNQPPLVPRQLLTFSALNTNASPAGWINDGDNETKGNNVDAHLDRNADDNPDLPRPHGNPFRVFDFPLDLTQSPTTYGDAAVVQLFYWCNWMHDQLYSLGFTEAAGNFQNDNFGRGGLGGDALQADAQDGSGTDNANMSTPPDGMSPRMQMYIFTGPKPNRDGDLDAEVVLHEYTHGLSNRRVGGGIGISALQPSGMGEGWSDFYALSLLSEPGDDVDGTYAEGGYASYLLGGLTENYYFGIRRYPYCTDMSKNPLTFRDIDPAQASSHPGIPSNPVIGGAANEVHDMGEVWCVTLWDARAALIHKHGFAVGNHLILQLVTDGMNLSPPNPNFLQARDAILQADLVDTGGANRRELWAAFAKRGMGFSATSPSSSTTSGLHEAYDVPDDLSITPAAGFIASGPNGGPFIPAQETFVLSNAGTNSLAWAAAVPSPWLNIQPASGSLSATGTTSVTVALDPVTANFPNGIYSNRLVFTNLASGRTLIRDFALRIAQADYFTEFFNGAGVPHNTTFTFTPDGSPNFYSASQAPATNFPTVPNELAYIDLANYSSQAFTLSGFNTVSLYGYATNVLFISRYGALTFIQPDTSGDQSYSNHFSLPRISALVSDLSPASGGTVYCQEMADHVAITFQGVYHSSTGSPSSFQVEMFFDGRIRLTYLDIGTSTCLIGLSAGTGLPADFAPSRFSDYGYGAAPVRLQLAVPPAAMEGQGQLGTPGTVSLPAPLATNLTVYLSSALPATVVVPSTVIITAGATNASFSVTVIDDHQLSGTRQVAISAYADGFGSSSAALTLLDHQRASLALHVPATAREGDGLVSGTLTVSAPPACSVMVNLYSSDTTEIQVPSFVIIPAGQTSTVFSITVVDDHEIDGSQTAALVASVDNWTPGIALITVLDNESTNLVVSVPRMVTEGLGTRHNAGIVRISGTLRTNLIVSLAASDPSRINVPSTITIPAGQTSAGFDLTIIDDNLAQGIQTVTITAKALGFASGSSSLQIWDDETPPTPLLRSPANLATGIAASNTCLVWNGGEGELAANGGFESGSFDGWDQYVTEWGGWAIATGSYVPPGPGSALPPYAGTYFAECVPIGSSHNELFQDFVIPAGAMSATLSWADRILNYATYFGDDQFYRVEIRTTNDVLLQVAFTTKPGDPLLSNWAVRSFDLSAYMGSAIRVVFVEEANPYYMNICLDSISLQLGASPVPTQYSVYLGTNSTLGSANLLGTTTNSAWNLPLLAPLTTYYWQIVSARVGQSTSSVWQFTTRGVDHFDLRSVASPQFFDQPFAVSLAARDELGRLVPNFTNSVSLSAVAGSSTTTLFEDDFEDGDISDWTVGYGSYTRMIDSQTAAVGTHSLSLSGGNQSPLDGVSHAFSSLTPRYISFYVRGSSASMAGGYFVVGDGQSANDINVVAFFFQNNDGTMGIYEDQGGWHGVPYEADRWYKISLVLDWDARQVDYYVDDSLAIAGIPFRSTVPTSITQLFLYNFDSTQAWWDDIRILSGPPSAAIAMSPSQSADFTNGTWSGAVTIHQPADSVHLQAQDGQAHIGVGNNFDVVAANNLSLTMAASTDLAAIGQNLTYTLVASNSGPQAATSVYIIDTLPAGAQFVSATNSHGIWVASADTVLFELGTLNGASAATLGVVVAPTGGSAITNWAMIMAAAPEAYTDDNYAELITQVMPALSIGDVALFEGNLGTTNAIFPVTLSRAFNRSIQVNYATTNGSALAGIDYIASSGTLIFSQGTTSNFISVAVIGNIRVESNKQFCVNLSAPVNASLARSHATGTILNDDGLTGSLYTLNWDPIASPQSINHPFISTLTARDAANRIATNFNGVVALSAVTGNRYAAVGTSTYDAESFPMGTSYQDERTQVIYLSSELGGPSRIKSLSLNVSTIPGQALNNWTIRMKHTPLSSYGYTASWEADDWSIMTQTNLTVTSSGLVTFYFATPFAYNGTDNLMVDFSFHNSSSSSSGYCYATYQGSDRTLYYQANGSYGDPLNWSGPSPYGYTTYYLPNIQLQFDSTVPVQPSLTSNFTNGVWSGTLSVQGMSPSATLLADDFNGHTGLSNPFLITSVNDLALGAGVASNAIAIGQQISCTLYVTNSGPQPATGVLVSNALPAGINLVSATSSQGSANVASNSVVFDLGQLNGGQIATMTLLFQPIRCTAFSLLAVASRNEPEEYLANNTAQTGFSVFPIATISDVAIKEGNVGTTPMGFHVYLSQPSEQPISIYYSTSDGTAIAGTDYLSTSGYLSFNAGVTSALVRVSVLGNVRIEPDKILSLNLSSPVNVSLARTSATGTIINDDGAPGEVFTLAWSPFTSPQYLGHPFAATLIARDAAGNVATNYNSKAALGAGKGAVHATSIGTATTDYSVPFYYYANARTQVIYLTNELAGAGQITSIALNVAENYGVSLNRWTVRMRHTPLSSYSTYAWETNGWTTVLQTNLSFSSTGWLVLPLTTPFDYNGVSNLMVDFSFSNSSADAYCWSTYRSAARTIYYGTDSTSDDPLSWSGTSSYAYSSYYTPDLQVNFGTPIGCQPAIADRFTNGVWSGLVSVFDIGNNIVLSADDRNGHVGFSAPFVVTPIDDLSLTVSGPDSLTLTQSLTYTIVVSNTGPSAATGIVVTNVCPPGTTFVSADSGAGRFARNGNIAVFTLDSLAPASSATFSLVLNPTRTGTLTNFASVSRNEIDNYLPNNTATTFTRVIPMLTIGDIALAEGNIGARTALFPLTLASAFDQPVQVNYFTANGTAAAGSDYIPTSGTVVFPPGTTSNVIAVTINGDVILEQDETFYVNLNAPVNASLARAQGIGTILNDDGFPGDIYSLRWSSIASPQYVNVPFAATLTALDISSQVATNFNGRVALTSSAGTSTNVIGTGTATESFPLGYYYPMSRSQIIYLASEVGGARLLSGVALNVTTVPGRVLNNFTIRMKHTALSSYSSYAWETNNWSVVLQTNLPVPASTGWLMLRLQTPFAYSGTSNLMVDFSYNAATYDSSYGGYCAASSVSQIRTLYTMTSSYGDPLNWSGSSPYPDGYSYVPNLSLRFDDQVLVQPLMTGNFTNGVWSGLVSLGEARPSLALRADDLNGHTNASNPFEVRLANDVAISLSDAPDPLTIGQNLTYTMVVTNLGPLPAQGVTVTNFLPSAVSYVSASTSQGTFTTMAGQVVFSLGTLPGPGSAVLQITVVPNAFGIATDVATLGRTDTDPYLANNRASVTTAIYPSASIAGTALKEGNVGVANAVFTVTLSGPYSQTVQLSYATANGTARSGIDYQGASGTLSFTPGTTVQTIAVPVLGNTLIEPNKTFVMNLTAVTNVIVSVGTGTCTILNDDGLPGDLYTLRWGTVSSPQFVNVPFATTLTALDASSQVATNFNSSVALRSTSGSRTNTIGTGTSTVNFPLGTDYHDERTQVIYLQSELGSASRIIGVALDVATVPGQILNNWTIRMKHTSLSQYGSTRAWEGSGWTVMLQTNTTVSSTGLVTFRFANSFAYNGVDNLMVDFSFNNSSYTSDGYCRATSQSTTRTIYYRTDSGYGDPLNWSGTSSPSPYSSSYTPNLRMLFDDGVAVQPAFTGNFTNGVWSGMLSLGEVRSNLVLQADDLNGHAASSNPFEVRLANDISISLSDSPDPLPLGQNLTYTMVVTNLGPSPALGVTVTNFLPSTVTFVSADTSQGSWTNMAGQLVFNLGALSGPGSAVLHITVTPNTLGLVTDVATVARTDADAYLPNNTTSVTSGVYPLASISGTSLKEGNVGNTNAIFTVTLSGSYYQAVQLTYATANGSALAGVDYQSTSGTLTFSPGATTQTIAVPVIGNATKELDKTFFVNVTALTNVIISVASANCTILNDDGLPGDLYSLRWDTVPSPQYVSVPFAGTLTALDFSGQVATNFNGSVVFTCKGGIGTNFIGSSTITQNFPLGTDYHDERTQVIYLQSELGAASQISGLTLNVSSVPGQLMSNFTIRMKHTSLSQYGSSPVWESSGWTVMVQTNLTVSSTGLLTFRFANPFTYDGVNNLMVDFSFNNSSYTSDGYCYATSQSATRTIYYRTDSGYGDPLAWSGTSSPSPSTSTYTPNIGLLMDGTISLQPLTASAFTNGVWSGWFALSEPKASQTLKADDLNGHTAASNPFEVRLANDVAISLSDAPDPLPVGQYLTYTMVVTNLGPSTAQDVSVTNFLPSLVTFVSADSTQGTWTNLGGQVVFSLGALPGPGSALLHITVVPSALGLNTDVATVARTDADAYLPNNTASVTTAVYPSATITDTFVKEGNLGTTNAIFTVSLSGSYFQTVQLVYFTANGTARAGADYLSTSGTLTFPPGTTTQNISVPVMGNTTKEMDKTFFVNITAVTNVTVSVGTATGTILDDDGLPGDLYTLRWATIPSPQYVNSPFLATLTALDFSSQVATNFNGSVALSSTAGTRTNLIGTGTGTESYLLGYYYHSARTESLYLTNEIGGARTLTAIALNVSTVPGRTLNNFTIRMKHTDLSSFNSYVWDNSNWNVVLQTNLPAPAAGWLILPLQTPFAYNGTSNLMVDFSYNATSYDSSYGGYCAVSSVSQVRTLTYNYGDGYGDPLTWSGTSPYPNAYAEVPNISLRFVDTVPIQPNLAGNFTNGVWSGWLTVSDFRSSLTLRADDLNGHTAASNPFEVRLANDIAISLSDAPDPLTVGQSLTYTMVVTNTGPSVAQGVMVTNFLSSTVNFVSASASQGTYDNSAGQVVFNLGDLAASSSAVLRAVVVPTATGMLTNTASVGRTDADGYLPNNTASTATAVIPIASIAATSVREGNVGTTNAYFTVSLSGPFDQTVQMSYVTSDSTARAGVDYVSVSGTLSFSPGVTNLSIAVPIIGNTLIEPNKIFFATITAVTNVVLSTRIAGCTIVNDDGLPGDAYTLEWDPISWQIAGRPFTSTITARDAAHNVATNFGGNASLFARNGVVTTNTTGTGTYNESFPLGYYYYRMARTQTIYPTNELGAAGMISAIALNVLTPPGRTLDNFTIRIKHTTLTNYSTYAWDSSGWSTVLQTNLPIPATGWLILPLQTPFVYNGTNSLMVDFSFSAASYDYSYSYTYCAGSYVSRPRTLFYTSESYGNPLTWSGTSPSPSVYSYVPNLMLVKGGLPPVSPQVVGPFSSGLWSGSLAIGTAGTNVTIVADDLNGHLGASSPFVVVPGNNLGVTLAMGPATPAVGSNFTFTLTVANTMLNGATGILVTNRLPASVSFVSADPPAVCVGNVLSWSLNSLAFGSNATFSIVANGAVPGPQTNVATVKCNEPDSVPADNSAQLVIRVFGSEVAVFDDPVYVSTLTTNSTSREEQSCLTNLCFPVVTFTDIASATASHQQLLFPELFRRDLSGDLSATVRAALSNFVYRGGKIIVHGSATLRASRLINKVFGSALQETYSPATSFQTADAAGTIFGSCPASVPANSFMSSLQRSTLPSGSLSLYTNANGTSVSLMGFGNGCVVFLGWNWTNSAPIGPQDGGWSSVLSAACFVQPPAPAAPVNLAAEAALNMVKLTWTALPAATNYTLKRAESSHGPYTVVARLRATNYLDSAVIGGKPYFYVVSASNGWGESPDSIEVTATPHQPPQLTALLSEDLSGLTLAWPSWATNYHVYSSTNLIAPVWLPVTDPPQSTNDVLFYYLPITVDPQKFFRLGQP